MISPFYSFIIPVYNRPQEIDDLLFSFSKMYVKNLHFEILIIEDGSTHTAQQVCEKWAAKLPLVYHFKLNSGPGKSRNYGMEKANGNHFIILDSDVTLPPHYLKAVDEFLKKNPEIEFWGGADRFNHDFSNLQKAIDFSMTSFLTTGGIRGSEKSISNFEPRSFNMGISKKAFEASNGFGRIHPGEDPDLSLRLQQKGFQSAFIPNAYVFHKRRIDLQKFQQQIRKFGLVRPILMKWHPSSKKTTFFLPSLFVLALIFSFLLFVFQLPELFMLFVLYFVAIFIQAFFTHRSFKISSLAVATSFIQLFIYGTAFLESYYYFHVQDFQPEERFPELFFKE